jgi:hypothetical protein
VCPMGAARRCVMVDWMVCKGIRLNSYWTLHDSSYPYFCLPRTFTHTFIHKLSNSKINHGCTTRGPGGVTDVESAVDSSGIKGGFVASGEGETRGGAVNPAIRLLIADASLWVEVWAMTAPCGLAGTPLPVFPASTQGRQKPVAC